MATNEKEYQFIDHERYNQYLESLPASTQLRYIAYTSKDGNRATIFIVPHPTKEYTLIIPYYLSKSHLSKGIGSGKNQTVREVAYEGFEHETQYKICQMELLGSIEVKNSIPDSDVLHVKHIILVEQFVYNDEKIFNEYDHPSQKTGEPVWMHNDLLPLIFKGTFLIGELKKNHPQRLIYYRHTKWLSSSIGYKIIRRLKKFVAGTDI